MTDTTARINAKGLTSTGITEELARKLHDNLGMKLMCVVEVVAQDRGENLDGKQRVQLNLLSVEPAPDQATADHLRNLARAIYHGRRLHDEDEQPQLDGVSDVEPTVEEVLGQGQGVLPEPPADDEPWEYERGEGQPGDHSLGDAEEERAEEPVRG